MRISPAGSRVVLLGIVSAGIAYGSLYPFIFRVPPHGAGPVHALISSWRAHVGIIDFFGNILFYTPLGFFAFAAASHGRSISARLVAVLLFGALGSLGFELAQYFIPSRVTSVSDLVANALGTLIGASFATVFQFEFRWPWIEKVKARPYTSLVLAAWLGYRLVPFVPVLDMHKYWNAVKAVVLAPSAPGYDVFLNASEWLLVSTLIARMAGYARSLVLIPLLLVLAFVADVVFLGEQASLADLIGAVVSFAGWLLLGKCSPRSRNIVISVLLTSYVVVWRLMPFKLSATVHDFNMMPFSGFLEGSIILNFKSFFQKCFIYGGLIWLLGECGLGRRLACSVVVFITLGTSIAEMFLNGHEASSTDAVMALVLSGTAFLMEPLAAQRDAPSEQTRQRHSDNEIGRPI